MIFSRSLTACPYCGKESVLCDSGKVYKKSRGPIYLCEPCQAWVGVHEGTSVPLGTLANKELRHYRKLAHYSFDLLWEQCSDKKVARTAAYIWLSKYMNVDIKECHIAMFNVDQCRRVITTGFPFLSKYIR